MEDLTLTIQKRAFPRLGRARVNAVVLKKIGINEREDLDVFGIFFYPGETPHRRVGWTLGFQNGD